MAVCAGAALLKSEAADLTYSMCPDVFRWLHRFNELNEKLSMQYKAAVDNRQRTNCLH